MINRTIKNAKKTFAKRIPIHAISYWALFQSGQCKTDAVSPAVLMKTVLPSSDHI